MSQQAKAVLLELAIPALVIWVFRFGAKSYSTAGDWINVGFIWLFLVLIWTAVRTGRRPGRAESLNRYGATVVSMLVGGMTALPLPREVPTVILIASLIVPALGIGVGQLLKARPERG